jgi:hypothetical protein
MIDTLLTDKQARRIAASWHAPRPGHLAALQSTGAVPEGILQEIEANKQHDARALPLEEQAEAVAELDALHDYCTVHAGRGPVVAWHALTSI